VGKSVSGTVRRIRRRRATESVAGLALSAKILMINNVTALGRDMIPLYVVNFVNFYTEIQLFMTFFI
jgi:hypothetical protein